MVTYTSAADDSASSLWRPGVIVAVALLVGAAGDVVSTYLALHVVDGLAEGNPLSATLMSMVGFWGWALVSATPGIIIAMLCVRRPVRTRGWVWPIAGALMAALKIGVTVSNSYHLLSVG